MTDDYVFADDADEMLTVDEAGEADRYCACGEGPLSIDQTVCSESCAEEGRDDMRADYEYDTRGDR